MFYSQFILAKKGPLGTIWIAAHLERKLRKNQVADTDIGVSVDSILFPEVPIALRLSSHLLLGVVRIYSRKVNYLFHDCSEALLKIKQAFRSTAVDLPPEESTAPYHSITLPETFHLDDFELPDAAFQGDFVDHHISTKEQITLQDNPERIGYSTSQFGLDERFGDGNSVHIGLDLEEELFLNKDQLTHASIQLGSDDGTLIQGPSAVPCAHMDVDDDQTKDGRADGYNNMVGPSGYDKLHPLSVDDLRRNNDSSNWNSYNIQTPDLNEIFFPNDDAAGPSAAYNQASPFPADGPMSPELVECAQAPATPGLVEETIPSRVRESPVLSPPRKASPSSTDDAAKADNSINLVSDFPHSSSVNGNDVVDTEMVDLATKARQVESSDTVQDAVSLGQKCSNVGEPHLEHEPQIGNNAKDNTPVDIQENSQDLQPQVPQDRSHHPLETSNLEAGIVKSMMDAEVCNSSLKLPNANLVESGETGSVKAPSIENGPPVESASELCTDGLVEPLPTEKPLRISEASVEVQGDNLHAANATETNADLQQNMEQLISEDVPSNDKPHEPLTSEFPEPEKMLLAPPHSEIDQANDLGQITAEKGATESDGSVNRISTLSGKKRRLGDSLPALENGSTGKIPSKPRIRRNTDFIPDDDDILASILVGKRTPGLRIGPTPPPPKATSLKRPRLASKMGMPKRKVLLDDAMVLHADTIRQQLISTEDIRRIRKKAPCTRSEIWMIEKGSLEDEIFNESAFTCASAELNNLQYRTYEVVGPLTIRNMEIQGRSGASAVEAQDSSNGGTSGNKENSTLNDPPQMELSNGAQSCAVQLAGSNASVVTLPVPSAEQGNHECEVNAGDALSHGIIEPSAGPPKMSEDDASHFKENHSSAGDETGGTGVGNDAFVDNIDIRRDIPADFNKSANCETPLCVLDGSFPEGEAGLPADCATDIRDTKASTPDVVADGFNPTYMAPMDEMKDELNNVVQGYANAFENKGIPNSGFTGTQCIQVGSDFPQPTTTDENVASTTGENSGLQENNLSACMDVESMGHDFALKESSDFCSAIQDVDTDFLNVDDEEDYEEANNDVPNTEEFHTLENSGWSSRTRGVAKYLKTLFDEEYGLGRKIVAIDHLLTGKTRKEASRMFFETLVLKTRDYIHVEQENSFDLVCIKPGIKLMKSEF